MYGQLVLEAVDGLRAFKRIEPYCYPKFIIIVFVKLRLTAEGLTTDSLKQAFVELVEEPSSLIKILFMFLDTT